MKLYTIPQIVELIGVSDKTVRRAIQSGKLKATKEARSYKITQNELDNWLAIRLDTGLDNLDTDIDKLDNRLDIEQDKLDNEIDIRQDNLDIELDIDYDIEKCDQETSSQGGLVAWSHVQELQNNLSGAVYRAGLAEGRAKALEQERDRLLDHIATLEQRLEKQQVDILDQQSEMLKQLEAKIETREKAFQEAITAWREAATTSREEKKPWWKFWA